MIKQLILKFPFLEISEFKGHETFNLRNHLGLPKSKNKAARDASAHVNDAIALACSIFRSYVKNNITKSADYIGELQLTKFYFKCISRLNTRPHKLHVVQFSKGRIRRSYGGLNKIHSFSNGDLVRYRAIKKNLLGYVQSNDLYNFVNSKWKRIHQLISNKNLKIVTYNCNNFIRKSL